jgi:hypothetical protein
MKTDLKNQQYPLDIKIAFFLFVICIVAAMLGSGSFS